MKALRLGLVLATAALAACSVSGTLEHRIEDELQARVGPADRYQATVTGLRTGAGEADHVQAIGYGIRARNGPEIDHMQIDLYDVRYDRVGKRLEHADSVRATVWVTSSALGAYLETIDGVGKATVLVQPPDSATIRMRPSFAGIPLPAGAAADVSGRLRGQGPYLRFEISEVGAAGFHAGDAVARHISQLINPLVDLSDLPLGLDFTGVSVEGRTIRVDATGDATSLRR